MQRWWFFVEEWATAAGCGRRGAKLLQLAAVQRACDMQLIEELVQLASIAVLHPISTINGVRSDLGRVRRKCTAKRLDFRRELFGREIGLVSFGLAAAHWAMLDRLASRRHEGVVQVAVLPKFYPKLCITSHWRLPRNGSNARVEASTETALLSQLGSEASISQTAKDIKKPTLHSLGGQTTHPNFGTQHTANRRLAANAGPSRMDVVAEADDTARTEAGAEACGRGTRMAASEYPSQTDIAAEAEEAAWAEAEAEAWSEAEEAEEGAMEPDRTCHLLLLPPELLHRILRFVPHVPRRVVLSRQHRPLDHLGHEARTRTRTAWRRLWDRL